MTSTPARPDGVAAADFVSARDESRWGVRLAAPVEGALWMLFAVLIFSASNGMIHHLATELHPFQLVFLRNLFSLLFMLPWLLRIGVTGLGRGKWRRYLGRAATGLGSMLAWFYALGLMPLGEATALGFTTPLFTTIAAALFLREIVPASRWAATAVGFAGVLIIVRPGADALTLPALVCLLSAVFTAVSMVQVKTLARTDPTTTVVAYMALFLMPLSLGPALAVWQTPAWTTLGWIAGIGFILTIAHLALTRALHLADASAMLPLDYAKLPFAVLIGALFFGESMDAWSWLGAAVIAGSTFHIAFAGRSR